MKSKLEAINSMIDRIHEFGCTVTIPYSQPSPLVVLFDGYFSSAAYIPLHPSTLYIYGMDGSISVSDVAEVRQISDNTYVITFGRIDCMFDMMIKILK